MEEDNESIKEHEGSETLQLDDTTVGIQTSATKEKCHSRLLLDTVQLFKLFRNISRAHLSVITI
jgi:hypothetical protein